MSPFSRIIPHALCCFYIPQQDEDAHRQSPIRPIPPTVPRKPAPYAMINVPHEPEMTEDVHAFRRMFTQSPACPHGSTPIQEEKPRPKRLEPKGSLDMTYSFSSRSPIPMPKKSTSIQRLGEHIKQKMSESGLRKSSLSAESRDAKEGRDDKQRLDPISGGDAVLLGVSAHSTGLSGLLKPGTGSADAYDSDAKSIKTPYLLSAAATIAISPEQAPQTLQEQELRPDDSVSTHVPSPKPVETIRNRPHGAEAHSSPLPATPKKPTFNEALHLKPDESTSATLKRLSAGIADGTIKPPTENELRTLKKPELQHTGWMHELPGKVPTGTLNLKKDPDTPQTVIKRLSERVLQEKRASVQSNGTTGKEANLLDELHPALLEYRSRPSPKHSPESNRDMDLPQTAVRDTNGLDPAQESRRDAGGFSETTTSLEQSRTDVASIRSNEASELRSVHLFNMHISQRLASKSTATMSSPLGSGNISRMSLDSPPPMPGAASTKAVTAQYPLHIRAEHNRRPSDPHTRKLFEQPGQMLPPPWKPNTNLDGQGLRPQSRGEASSVYTSDGGPPSSSGNLSHHEGITNTSRNPNSLAIGGRSMSTEISVRRSSKNQHSISGSQELRSRSLSTSVTERPSQLEAASNVINRYIDGNCEDRDNGQPRPTLTAVTSESTKGKAHQGAILAKTVSAASKPRPVDANQKRRASAGWLTTGQRIGWNYNFVSEPTTPKARQGSALSTNAPDTATDPIRKSSTVSAKGSALTPSPLAESATDMWNRAYRDARKDNGGQDLLSTPTIEMDDLRRSSSTNTIRLSNRPSASVQTPQTAIRRSHSAGPHTRQPLRVDDANGSGQLAKTLNRLSIRHLRSHRPLTTATAVSGPRKLQKRSSPELAKKVSKASVASVPRNPKVRSPRAGNTPPLKELLGIWGTFPSHDRADRNGAADEADDVHARDFCRSESASEARGELRIPLQGRPSTGALSAMHSSLRMLSARSKRMDRKRAKSMSFPVTSGDRVQKQAKVLFLNRWRRVYRTKSSQWRGHLLAGGHRSSIFPGQSVEYPELESLPGEGMFASTPWRADSSNATDGASSVLAGVLGVVGDDNSSPVGLQGEIPIWPSASRDRVDDQNKTRSTVALRELTATEKLQKDNARKTSTTGESSTRGWSCQQATPSSSDNVSYTTPKNNSDERPSPLTRDSKDIKLPGSFGDDD
ncbi:hypothetical protein LTR70_007319 [Exophiala xenobiotica]|uniref:Uncharacterized protein n=1 Tax=Lithohypha guttulata TaxID=1690604 RepID=A0ABR0K4B1_9EURO|nr:hypothetical protein LTR24_007089 [Lithohypha guttulata]KAK5314108.1 hypothetical protein LTR70_007319 [Exophiala xenobiotica]